MLNFSEKIHSILDYVGLPFLHGIARHEVDINALLIRLGSQSKKSSDREIASERKDSVHR